MKMLFIDLSGKNETFPFSFFDPFLVFTQEEKDGGLSGGGHSRFALMLMSGAHHLFMLTGDTLPHPQ